LQEGDVTTGSGKGHGVFVRAGQEGFETACRFIETLVAGALGIGLAELRGEKRGRASAAYARQTAMYLAHVHFGLSLSQVGRSFGRDRTTVAHACARIEDSRDDPKVERVLACLEVALDRWRQSFFGAEAA
jgi:chromosomal replication initiation ATPase DnaA